MLWEWQQNTVGLQEYEKINQFYRSEPSIVLLTFELKQNEN